MDKNQNTLDENLENKVDEVKEDLHEAREDVKEHMERAKERARDTFDDVKEKAEDAKERVKNEAADIKEDMKNFGKTHPWSFLGKLEEFGHEYLVKKAPFQLPDGFKEFLVKIAPYAIIIVAVLAVPAILALFGLSSSLWGELGRYGYNYGGYRTMFYVTSIISLLALVLELFALPGLFSRKKQGRNLIFYAQLVSVVGLLLQNNILSFILSLVIGMYVLFQVRSYYKG